MGQGKGVQRSSPVGLGAFAAVELAVYVVVVFVVQRVPRMQRSVPACSGYAVLERELTPLADELAVRPSLWWSW